MTDIELRSLAPEYSEDHHKSYVSRLNESVTDTRNKNIALTGRYGAGKSSILDEFIKGQEQSPSWWKRVWQKVRRTGDKPKKVLRISITTLGPDKDEDLTNRIQKELVKQLVYRARPGEVRRSEFSRTPELSWWRTILEGVLATTIIVGLLWVFGVRPKEPSGTDDLVGPMIVFSALVFAALVFARRYIGNHVVAQVSAGGASISLEGKSDSFFDKYLDELLAFFEATEPDIVVFEDLDRFNDPQIFDSLRELNTLVNTSAHWRKRSDRPLRFIYAIKDSLFEKLGDEQRKKDAAGQEGAEGSAASGAQKTEKSDVAAAAVERANRTKFFEIVIPVVPFLSHSNARDHFLMELGELKLPLELDNGLIDIVARHTTDMRLMINIGNEFVVYAERLLWVKGTKRNRAPGLTADRLFALVVYKNFHLADFEALPHRGSALDRLEKARRDLVNASITALQQERASLVSGEKRRQRQQELAAKLGERLGAILQSGHMSLGSASADTAPLSIASIDDPTFWQAIAQAKRVEIRLDSGSVYVSGSSMDRARLSVLFPEIDDLAFWRDVSTQSDKSRVPEIDTEIAALRGIGFKQLFDDGRYELDGKPFAVHAKAVLPSQLAVDLVEQGQIDRFYAEYSTIFYGKFLGVDVANFFRNSVWPNEMDVELKFTTLDAAKNVLAQAPTDFLHTRSALNIDIVDYLMGVDHALSTDLIEFLARPNNIEGRQFLKAYLNRPGTLSEELVSRLAAKPWPGLFSFIASAGVIDADETTVALLDAALRNASSLEAFELDDDARTLIERLHTEIPTFRETARGASAKTLFAFLTAALPIVPNIRVLSPELQALVVSEKRYALDASNLRAAAALSDETSICADSLIAKPAVWAYCTENIEDYLELIGSDERTPASCESPGVLAQVVNAQHEDWSADALEAFLDASAESAALPDVNKVEQTAWPTVAARLCVVPNFTNLEAYATEIGVDDVLGTLLVDDDGEAVNVAGLENATTEQLAPVIPLLLNAHAVLEARQRVLLAKQLLDAPNGPGFDLSEVEATRDDLLAELLREAVVDDIEEAFSHFAVAGWDAIGPALQVSTDAATFITPALVQGHAAEILREKSFPDSTKRALLDQLVELAPAEGQPFLLAAARAARMLGVTLPTDALLLLAPAVSNHEDVVWQLKEQAGSISVRTVMGILGSMSGNFVGFAGSSGQAFEVGNTQSLRAVVGRLKLAGVIKLQPGGQPRDRWKLRIA